MYRMYRLFLIAWIAATASAAAPPAWVERSNRNAKILLDVQARFAPEAAARTGVEGIDREVVDLKARFLERNREATRKAIGMLHEKLDAETDVRVRQDLEILIRAAELDVKESVLSEKYTLPYFDVTRFAFGGIRGLLDDQIAADRRPAALVRLRRYAGMEDGYAPLAKLAEERIRERLSQPGLLAPFKGEIEKSLADSQFLLDGIEPLFRKFGVDGYEEPLAKLKTQIAAYHDFVRREILPKSRTDFRLPEELYALSLEQYGNDMPPAALAQRARGAFLEIQGQMQEIAGQVAREREWSFAGYRDVIRELKKKQLVGDAILPHYKQRLAQIEEIVRRENLVTLPGRPARIRIASEAESAAMPAPNMRPPRLLGNTGESGEFVLPLNVPDTSGRMKSFDDFTFEAASWTLTAHEARPGHEMQFASIVERGVSTARAVFAFNSTNVEGWGLYAEAVIKPFLPSEGQLIALQHRLLRAARAFLDPELQLGRITPEEAKRVLMEDVVMSDAMATQEVERYTFRAPGQAPSYYYGYTKLMELRQEAEKAMAGKFDAKRFHDFVLAQGLVPPSLLRAAVFEEFVPQAGGAAGR